MRSIARLADYGFAYINQSFLKIDYNIAANNSGTYVAWEIMRNIANALFVVALMIIIYSQLTGRGGGYSIKRLVPKLILAAIFVNVSYFLCVFLIDIANILGDSIINILVGIAGRVGSMIMPIDMSSQGISRGTLTIITSSILSQASSAWVLLAPVAAVVVTVATICAAGVVVLIMRKTVIAMLILASPILFVAYLLPNLERFFFQGVRLYVQLLLIYPIAALLLGTGQIVSATLVSVGSNDTNYRIFGDWNLAGMLNGGSGSAIIDLTAAGAAVLPLIAIWFVFKNMSSVMSMAGTRLSASMAGRRGGSKEDEKAKVTGNALAGAANKVGQGIGGAFGNRRQAFSRSRRRSSLGGSAQFGQNGLTEASRANNGPRAGNRQPTDTAAADALQNSIQGKNEDMKKQLEGLNEAKLSGDAEGLNIENAMANALAENSTKDQENKKITAKDLFNDINKAHESKDKGRKLSAGPPPAGSNNGQSGGGSPQPTAPTTSYRAPQMAQSGNIVSGGSSAQQPVKIVAVPVQIDASALLSQNNKPHSPDTTFQPPVSGNEEKAKARAQKYLYDSQRDIDDAQDKADILRHRKDAPTEPPHSDSKHDGGS